MMAFYTFGLKTHIETEVVNESTNEKFTFSFIKKPNQGTGTSTERRNEV